MKFVGITFALYGIIVILGGLIGYLTAGSLASLVAGSISGAALFASGLGIYRSSIIAFFTGLSVAIALTLFFSIRYYLTSKMMPSGMMALLSVVMVLLLLTAKGRPIKRSRE